MNQAHLPSKISLLVFALFVSLSTAFSEQRPNIHPCGRHGLFRYRLLRRRGEDTPSRPTGREWSSFYEHVQHFQVLPVPSLLAHWGLCTTMRHEPQFKGNQECDNHGRSSKNRGLSYLGGGQAPLQS